jgi:hypothetical protein
LIKFKCSNCFITYGSILLLILKFYENFETFWKFYHFEFFRLWRRQRNGTKYSESEIKMVISLVKLSFLFNSEIMGGLCHVFWSDTHYSISLRYKRNIVQLNSFYIKFDSKHFKNDSFIYKSQEHTNVQIKVIIT